MSRERHGAGSLHVGAFQCHCCEQSLMTMALERVAETAMDHCPAVTPRANLTTASALAGS